MGEWLADFSGLELFFLACAAIGGFFVLVKLVLQFVGGDGDLDSAVDPDIGIDADHTNSDTGFRVLSLHGLSSFFMMFGLVGLAFSHQSQAGLGLTLGGAVLAGLGSVWVIGKLFQGAGRLQFGVSNLDWKTGIVTPGGSVQCFLPCPPSSGSISDPPRCRELLDHRG